MIDPSGFSAPAFLPSILPRMLACCAVDIDGNRGVAAGHDQADEIGNRARSRTEYPPPRVGPDSGYQGPRAPEVWD